MNERGDIAATTLAVIALIIAIFAGVLAWMAYDRTGADLDERIRNQVGESMQNIGNDLQDDSTPTDQSQQNDTTPDEVDDDNSNTGTDTVPQTQP